MELGEAIAGRLNHTCKVGQIGSSGLRRSGLPELKAKQLLAIRPGFFLLEARTIGQVLEHLRRVLVRVLGVDRFPFGEPNGQAGGGDRDFLDRPADQVHLDPAEVRAIAGLMLEPVEVEPAAQFAVDSFQEVEVEPGGHPLGVVVGGFEEARVLVEVGAEEQAVRRVHVPGQHREQLDGLVDLVVADAGTEEGEELGAVEPLDHAGQGVPVVRRVAGDAEPGEPPDQRLGRLFEDRLRDVDRHVMQATVGADRRRDQPTGLRRAAAAQLDHHGVDPPAGDHRVGVLPEDRVLGPGQVILGQVADLFEQARALVIVKVAAGERLGLRPEAGSDGMGESAGRFPGGLSTLEDRQAPGSDGVCGLEWQYPPLMRGFQSSGPRAGNCPHPRWRRSPKVGLGRPEREKTLPSLGPHAPSDDITLSRYRRPGRSRQGDGAGPTAPASPVPTP